MRIVLPIAAALAMVASSFAADANSAKATAHRSAHARAWAPQTVSGTLTIVEPAQKRIVVQTASGVPYDMDITRATRIENRGQRVSLQALNQDVNQAVEVKLIPERRGDVAAWIRIGK
jgi:hypothetical protein